MYPFDENGNFVLDSVEHKLSEKLISNNLSFTVNAVKDKIILSLDKIGKVFITGEKVSVILIDYRYLNLRLLIEGLFRGRNATDGEWSKACV